MTRDPAAVILVAVVALAGPACESARTTDPGVATGGSIMPQDPRQRRNEAKEARFQTAIDGLSFKTGLIVVTEPAAETGREAADAWRVAGLEEFESNHRTGAVADFALAVRADPSYVEAYMDLGRGLVAKGKVEHALAAFRTAMSLDPEAVDAIFEAATSLARTGDHDQAIEQMLPVVELDPGHAEAHERLAVWYYYTGETAAAWEHVRAARDLGHEPPGQFVALLESRSPQQPVE